MIAISSKSIVIEMDKKDLWHIGTTLVNGILLEVQKKWIKYHKEVDGNKFLEYVKLQNYISFQYLKEIFNYLNRMDIIETLEMDIVTIYVESCASNDNNLQKRDT
ncbi:hypothetical protein BSK59_20010 [Paenibacillus odorifer]|uniref:hypothetical protein n=1 Tax=Paenibacillus odorifer TaxID=189426 RepID=UPI00096E3537|nr:hypothetical protein [Paenibacillus odorifer]OME51808.1 hypothetical protein BSK59_20010 [Paenibacillus odorifer]